MRRQKMQHQVWNHKWKIFQNTIAILIGMFVILGIMFLPVVYFQRVDASRYHTRHYMEQIRFALDTDVQNVYIVNRIHSYLKSPYSNGDSGHIKEEVTMLSSDKGEVLFQIKDAEVGYMTKRKKKGIRKMLYDKQSQKVLEVKYTPTHYNQKKYIVNLCSYAGDQKMEKQLKKFWKYLGLDVLEDWNYDSIITYWGDRNVSQSPEEIYQTVKNDEEMLNWCIYSESAKLELHAKPQKDGIRYYFQARK